MRKENRDPPAPAPWTDCIVWLRDGFAWGAVDAYTITWQFLDGGVLVFSCLRTAESEVLAEILMGTGSKLSKCRKRNVVLTSLPYGNTIKKGRKRWCTLSLPSTAFQKAGLRLF